MNKFTIFSLPKPLLDPHISLIQRNAISSWIKTGANTIIIGDEENIEEESNKLGAKHIGTIRKSEFGTPLLNDAFRIAEGQSEDGEILMYSNADMIFFDDLVKAVEKLPSSHFLAVGRRTDFNINFPVDFSNNNEIDGLKEKAKKNGKVHSPAGIDYFIFRKGFLDNMPPLVVGRIGWDNWMIWNAKNKKISIIDLTKDVLAIHQNHPSLRINTDTRKTNPEALHNISFIKGRGNACTIEDADYKMVNGKIVKNYFSFLPKLKRYLRSIF